uniref:Glycosyltransferase n=1 Tax=Kalanchoe fedtschenkoi TaxID=63787 RepID=A0A7N0UF68_KALFE
MGDEKPSSNVVMFPFMAQGHIIPFLALALKIKARAPDNLTISIVNTPLNIANLRASLPDTAASIELLELPFDAAAHGLPPHAQNTDVLPYPLVIRLIRAAASLKPAFSRLISDLTARRGGPVCVVADIFLGWTVDVARELGVHHAVFCGGGGFGFGCYYSVWVNTPHRKTQSREFALPDFPEAGKLHISQLPANQLNADGVDPWSTFQSTNLPKWIESDALLFNTVEELDAAGLAYFRRVTKKNVWAIGPVVLAAENRRRVGKKQGIASDLCKSWLDSKPPNSVLYVSFGSNNTISAPHMTQLAAALETSGVNFIWVVRPPLGFDINSEFRDSEWLPEGFVERIEDGKRGLVVRDWAPQVEILSHPSVAAFVSHCGWGSVMEALSEGVVLLGWPMAGEQFYNAKFLVEVVGVCVEVARGSGWEVRQEDIASKIAAVMRGREGEEMRGRAAEVREMVRAAAGDADGSSSTKAMDDFFRALCGVV